MSARRFGSAIALNGSKVVRARAILVIYSNIGICQLGNQDFPLIVNVNGRPPTPSGSQRSLRGGLHGTLTVTNRFAGSASASACPAGPRANLPVVVMRMDTPCKTCPPEVTDDYTACLTIATRQLRSRRAFLFPGKPRRPGLGFSFPGTRISSPAPTARHKARGLRG